MLTMIKNLAGHEFSKRPEVCPNCNETLKSNVKIEGEELSRFNVTPDNPYLYSVTEVVKSTFNRTTGEVDQEQTAWLCSYCNTRFGV